MCYKDCVTKCKFTCFCCKRHADPRGYCFACENKDEFHPAENIIYCPLTGLPIKENYL